MNGDWIVRTWVKVHSITHNWCISAYIIAISNNLGILTSCSRTCAAKSQAVCTNLGYDVPQAVVDARLRVRGTRGLRVVDASGGVVSFASNASELWASWDGCCCRT